VPARPLRLHRPSPNRDAQGRATARAVRIADAIQIDGNLDEPVYSQIASMSDVIQNDPKEGEPATKKPRSGFFSTMTTFMFTSALVQYNSSLNAVFENIRFRREYRPGSELFFVLNEQRDTETRRFSGLVNRAVVVKFNRLFRFSQNTRFVSFSGRMSLY